MQDKQILEQFMSAAKLMPEDVILDNIKTAIEKYKFFKRKDVTSVTGKDDDSQLELMMYTQMWMMKVHINKDGMAKAMTEINDMFNMKDTFKKFQSQ